MQRKFFDWNQPFLPAVAKEIVSEALGALGDSKTLDLGRFVYVLSGKRAARTLEAYLQREVDALIDAGTVDPDWIPPAYVTLGAAPERLYAVGSKLADHLARLYCMRSAIEEYFDNPTSESQALLKEAPKTFDAQLELADTFLKLKDELDSERSAYRFVRAKCEELEQPEEAKRWTALEQLDKTYSKALKENDLTELNRARVAALNGDLIGNSTFDEVDGRPCEYRILGAVDLNRLQKDIFQRLGDRVEFWVFAPQDAEDLFDEFGCVVPEKWERYEISLKDEQLIQVDSPAEQGAAVAYLTRELSKVYDENGWKYEPIAPTSLTIGTPDGEVVPFIEQHMEEIGYQTILGEGKSIVKNRVYQLLANVAEYVESRSFSSFEELMRRPDLYTYLDSQWQFVKYSDVPDYQEDDLSKELNAAEESQDDYVGNEEGEADEIDATDAAPAPESNERKGDWIADLDRYRSMYLPMRVTGKWFRFADRDSKSESRNFSFAALRKASYLLDRALEGFWNLPTEEEERRSRNFLQRTEISDVERLVAQDLKPEWQEARDRLLSGEYEFIKTGFKRTSQWGARQQRQPLYRWAKVLSNFLCKIYDDPRKANGGKRPYSMEAQTQIDGFFEEFNRVLTALGDLPEKLATETTGAEAIRIVLKELSGAQIAPTPGSNLVEMQGALDLLFDDAPYLILTGFNEGVLPSNRGGDLFLPNEMRSKVGLSDSQRVFARDAYLTTALSRSRRAFFVVFEKHTLQGDPILPSRFVFASDAETIPRRVVKFFAKENKGALPYLRARQLDENGVERPFRAQETEMENVDPIAALNQKANKAWEESQRLEQETFRAPELNLSKLGSQPPTHMNVTDFETFLNSPYRFMLKKFFKANPAPDPRTLELDAAKFGTFTHDVLRAFGESDKKDSFVEYDIYNWLSAELDRYVQNHVDEHTSPFVKIQIEQIRGRLRGFAHWQAEWRKTGAAIKFVETAPNESKESETEKGSIEYKLDDGSSIRIVGRVDRIDYNPNTNTWYVFDYKTFDKLYEGSKKDSLIVASDSGEELFKAATGNTIDKKHRVNVNAAQTKGVNFSRKTNLIPSDDGKKCSKWINLQIPLYRRLFWQILMDHTPNLTLENAKSKKVEFAYIILSKSGETKAHGAKWTDEDFDSAENAATWVVQALRKLWHKGVVKPTDPIDPDNPGLGQVLEEKKMKYEDEWAPITLSYTFE